MSILKGLIRSSACGVTKKYITGRKAGNQSDTLLDDILDQKMARMSYLTEVERTELRKAIKAKAIESL